MDSEDITMTDSTPSTKSKGNFVKPPNSPEDLISNWTTETVGNTNRLFDVSPYFLIA